MNGSSSPIPRNSDYHQVQDAKNLDSKAVFDGVYYWKTLEGFVEVHDQFHLNQLKWLLRNRKYNGLDKAVRKIGKRIYFHEQLFADWILTSA